jgi:glycerate dehydrogenase
MNIVVLDGFTLNPGDLTWGDLERLGSCQTHARTAPEEILARAAQADALLTNKTVLTADHLRALPQLRYIGVLATGTNVVDLAAARRQGIPVTNVPAYSTPSVAQTTFALLLELAQQAGHYAQTVRDGRWTQSPDFSYWDQPLIELRGLTMGIIGFGRIGQAVGGLAMAFGMEVIAFTPRFDQLPGTVRAADLETLCRQSDVVSLHCPLTDSTRHLMNAEHLGWMKSTAFLLNTSRGPLVDEPALAAALNSGRLAGAGLDVLSQEPPRADNPLLRAKNCVITPHQAWATRAARSRLMRAAVENLRAFMEGSPRNVVN